MKQLRILHVTRQPTYGSANVLDQLVRNFNRTRYEPIVAFETTEKSTIRQQLTDSDIKTIDLIKGGSNTIKQNQQPGKKLNISKIIENRLNREAAEAYLALKSVSRFVMKQTLRVLPFLKVIRENQIDLVHTHSNLSHAKPEIIAAWISGKPCVAHVHAYMEPTYFETINAKLVNTFIYISNDVEKHFNQRGYPPKKSKIVHNGIDLSRYAKPASMDNVRNEFGIQTNDVLVGLVGRIVWWKGHDYFIEAFAESSRKIKGLRGIIVGEPGHEEINKRFYESLKEKIKKLNLEKQILFTGFREDIPRLLSAMDIIVHASSQPEPFGLVAIEGMAARKPVIATAAGGILDIIQDGVSGLLVPCKDSGAMAKAIVELARDKNRAKSLGNASHLRVVEKFSIENQVKMVEMIYDTILSNEKYRR